MHLDDRARLLLPGVLAVFTLVECNTNITFCDPQRTLPGFWRQFGWCLGRAVTRRMREPLAVFTDYAIFALTGELDDHLQYRGAAPMLLEWLSCW